MSDKVYGICGTNKCKREVVPMTMVDEWTKVFTIPKSAFGTAASEGTYLYIPGCVFHYNEREKENAKDEYPWTYTCELQVINTSQYRRTSVGLMGTGEDLASVKDKRYGLYAIKAENTRRIPEAYIYITEALRKQLNDDTVKLLAIFRRYA